jgi:hypothetical protein
MGVFNKKNEDYNEKLKNAVEEYIITRLHELNKKKLNFSYFRQRDKSIKNIKKYADIKLKNESGFPNYQYKLLHDARSKSSKIKIKSYSFDTLRNMHLSPEDFESQHNDEVIEKLMTTGVPVTFPTTKQVRTNKAGQGAAAGGLLFGLAGAAVGGIMGSNDKQVVESTVSGRRGTLKVTDNGIVLSSRDETLRIKWDNIERMRFSTIYLVDGKHLNLYNIPDSEIISPIINYRAKPQIEDGW